MQLDEGEDLKRKTHFVIVTTIILGLTIPILVLYTFVAYFTVDPERKCFLEYTNNPAGFSLSQNHENYRQCVAKNRNDILHWWILDYYEPKSR